MYIILICVLIPSILITLSPPVNGSCLMPNNPPNGEYTIGSAAVGTYKPGSYVSPYSALRVICIRDHKPSPHDKPVAICINGEWSFEPPKCSLSCPGVTSTKTTYFTCVFDGRPMSSCLDPAEGTVATIRCALFHEESSVKQNPFRICRDGSWDRPFLQCYPACGFKHEHGTPNIIGGVLTGAVISELLDHPWHVGIYDVENKKHLCGGSILNERVILSAAHCFTDLNTGDKFPKENYLIAAGKYYRTYDDPRDTYAQYSSVEDIHIPVRYRGEVTQYEADLAVVVLKTQLELSIAVIPVCIDWQSASSEHQQFSENNLGTIVGWGQTTEGGQPSQKLRELDIPVFLFEQCYEEVPKPFRRYLAHDKVCAGFLNKGTAACVGDSGGGFTFLYPDGRYYIRAIISISPATLEGNCDSNQYATYTLVSKYLDFIKSKMI